MFEYDKGLFPAEPKFRHFLYRDVTDPWHSGDFSQTCWDKDITEFL